MNRQRVNGDRSEHFHRRTGLRSTQTVSTCESSSASSSIDLICIFPIKRNCHLLMFNVQRSTVTTRFLEGNFKYGKSLNLYLCILLLNYTTVSEPWTCFMSVWMVSSIQRWHHAAADHKHYPSVRTRITTVSYTRNDKTTKGVLSTHLCGTQITRRFQRDTETNPMTPPCLPCSVC